MALGQPRMCMTIRDKVRAKEMVSVNKINWCVTTQNYSAWPKMSWWFLYDVGYILELIFINIMAVLFANSVLLIWDMIIMDRCGLFCSIVSALSSEETGPQYHLHHTHVKSFLLLLLLCTGCCTRIFASICKCDVLRDGRNDCITWLQTTASFMKEVVEKTQVHDDSANCHMWQPPLIWPHVQTVLVQTKPLLCV